MKCTTLPSPISAGILRDQAQVVERLPERAPLRLQLERGQDAVGVGTDGEERGIAKVEQAGEADDDVQPERQRGIGRGVGHAVHVGIVVDVGSGNASAAAVSSDQADALALRLGDARERSRQDARRAAEAVPFMRSALS